MSAKQTEFVEKKLKVVEKGRETACVRFLVVFVLTTLHFLILLRQTCQVFFELFLFCRNQPLELFEPVENDD